MDTYCGLSDRAFCMLAMLTLTQENCILWCLVSRVIVIVMPATCVVVVATDMDSVTNSQLTYSVSNPHFKVQTLNNIGYIRTAK